MDYEKQLFERHIEKAPDSFVQRTMNYIHMQEQIENQKPIAKPRLSLAKMGQVCVTAAVILVSFNVLSIDIRDMSTFNLEPKTKIEQFVQKASDKFTDITQNIYSLVDFDIDKNN